MPPTPDEMDWWLGRLRSSSRPLPAISVRAPLRLARSSGAGAFLALADDGHQYWVKVPGNPQGDQVLVNEVIVGEVGKLIGSPVRDRVLITVPPELTRWSGYPAAPSTAPLTAHGSLHLANAVDADELLHTKRGRNSERQAAIVGLWDLCVGEDPQWLYETSAGHAIWSYDHGLWFTTGEGDWHRNVLRDLLRTEATLPDEPRSLDAVSLRAVADRILALEVGDILSVVSGVPVEWGTGDVDLEAMAWFLYNRRADVAARLRCRADSRPERESTGRAS